MKKTVVLGATDNPERFAFRAVHKLQQYGHEVVPVGIRKGKVGGLDIQTDRPQVENVDTVTLYVGSRNLSEWYDYILSLNPKRIIFNPGTENLDLERMAIDKGIDPVQGCTLVMLSVGQY